MMALLRRWQRQYRGALLLISHDATSVRDLATHILVLQQGQQQAYGRMTSLLAQDDVPLLKQWQAPDIAPIAMQVATRAAPVLELDRLLLAFPCSGNPLPPVSLQLYAGEMMALHGVSGVGKSTLAKTVIGLLAPRQGTLRLAGEPSATAVRQRQRCQQQAVALAAKPAVLICDEVTSALDALTARKILVLLQRLFHEHHMALLLITHQVESVRALCHRVSLLSPASGITPSLPQQQGEPVNDGADNPSIVTY